MLNRDWEEFDDSAIRNKILMCFVSKVRLDDKLITETIGMDAIVFLMDMVDDGLMERNANNLYYLTDEGRRLADIENRRLLTIEKKRLAKIAKSNSENPAKNLEQRLNTPPRKIENVNVATMSRSRRRRSWSR